MIGDEGWTDLGQVVANLSDIRTMAVLGKHPDLDAYVLLAGGVGVALRDRLIKSIDNGETWADEGPIGPVGAGVLQSFKNRENGRVFAGVGSNSGAILESTDWGDSWIQRWAAYRHTYALEACGINIMDSGHFFMGPVDRLGRSTDDGLTWGAEGSITANAHSITALLHVTGNILLAGTTRLPIPAKICRSTDCGETLPNSWTDVMVDGALNSTHCLCMSSDTGTIVAGVDDHVYRSTNQGLNWTDLGVIVLGMRIYDIEYFGNGIFLGVTNAGHVLRSTDDGQTWSDLGVITSAPPGENLFCIVNLENTLAYAGSSLGHIYYTGALIPPPVLGAPHDLLCEQKKNPTDVQDPFPEFSAIHKYE